MIKKPLKFSFIIKFYCFYDIFKKHLLIILKKKILFENSNVKK